MANSDWASEAFGPVDKSTWARRDLRTEPERRSVTHEDNGFVWGPAEKLLELVHVAARCEHIADHPTTTNAGTRAVLHDIARSIRDALGTNVD